MNIKVKTLILFLFLFLSTLTEVKHCQSLAPPESYFGSFDDYYDWHGDYPNYKFNLENKTITNETIITIEWEWWDEWTAGFGYAYNVNIVNVNKNIIIYNESVFIDPLLIDVFPYKPIYDFNKSFDFNFTLNEVKKETNVILQFNIIIVNKIIEVSQSSWIPDNFELLTFTENLQLNYSDSLIETTQFNMNNLLYFFILFGLSLVIVIFNLRKSKKEKTLVII